MSWYRDNRFATATFQLEQPAAIWQSKNGTWVCEASDQNLRSGEFPQYVSFKDGDLCRVFRLERYDRKHDEITGVYYTEVDGSGRLLIIND